MKEILESFEKSFKRFEEILGEKETIANRDSAIKRFEFTFELAWKVTQKFLRTEGIICRSPKECLRAAFSFGLIEDDLCWIAMLNDRNLTVHTYNEDTADEVYHRLGQYLDLFRELKIKLNALIN